LNERRNQHRPNTAGPFPEQTAYFFRAVLPWLAMALAGRAFRLREYLQAGPVAMALALALVENPVRWVDSSLSAVALTVKAPAPPSPVDRQRLPLRR